MFVRKQKRPLLSSGILAFIFMLVILAWQNPPHADIEAHLLASERAATAPPAAVLPPLPHMVSNLSIEVWAGGYSQISSPEIISSVGLT